MSGENENDRKNNNKRETVTTVGKSWVICDSKTRPPLKYYFNTSTGHSVWNISPAEIEKAKNFTNALSADEIEKCPEPIDPPMDYPQASHSRVYPPMDPPQPSHSGVYPLMDPPQPSHSRVCPPMDPPQSGLTGHSRVFPLMDPPQLIHPRLYQPMDPSQPSHSRVYPPMDPSQLNLSQVYNNQIINNPMQSQYTHQNHSVYPVPWLSGAPPNSGFNPNLWATILNNAAIPQGPVYTSYPPPLRNFQPSQDYAQNLHTNYQEKTSYLQDSKESSQNEDFQDNVFNREKRMHNSRSRFQQRNSQLTQNWNESPDLRQKLIRKRSKSQSCESGYGEDSGAHKGNDFATTQKRILISNIHEESPSKYDLTVLKKLKSPHSKVDHWFIVTDTETILDNFPFLNKITDPDQNCYLMVPDHIMTELQNLSYNGQDVRFRRIYRFLSEQIESELAFRGDDLSGLTNNDTEKAFITCEQLARNNNVIFLSNDIKLQKYKNNHQNVHVLTMNELKMMLKHEPMKRLPVGRTSPTLAVKISVPNDRKSEYEFNRPSMRIRAKSPPAMPSIATKKDKNIQANTQTQISSNFPPTSKLMVDTAVQAGDSLNHSDDNIASKPVPDTPESAGFDRCSEDSYFCSKDKRKEIKLVRTFPNQKTNTEGTTQKKRYRWRKQRVNTSLLINISNPSSLKDEIAVDNNANKGDTSVLTNPECNVTETALKPTFSPLARSSDKSSIVSGLSKKIGHPNILIEETSTSGVISYTNDSESVKSNSFTKDSKIVRMSHLCEPFKIDGPGMEEVLRTRRDEWVLRFVQIMEEVLREKLRENSQNMVYAEPWATDLPELTRCIIKKFSDFFKVVDAANKLSFTLYRLCDDKGNVSADIEPSQYMEMYSYGVYLIEALKEVTDGCEDLKAADESLKKLLYDIQNANGEFGHNDTLNCVDERQESTANVSKSLVVDEELLQPEPAPTKETNNDVEKQISKISYSLRSRKRKPSQIHYEPQQKVYSNDKAEFLSCLQLEKRALVKTLVFQDTVDDSLKSDNVNKSPSNVQLSLKIPESPKVPQSPKIAQSPKTAHSPKIAQSPKIVQSPKIAQSPKVTECLKVPQSPKTPQSPLIPQASPLKQLEVRSNPNEDIPSVKDTVPVVLRKFTSIPEFENLLNRSFEEEDGEEYADEHYHDAEYPLDEYHDTEYPPEHHETEYPPESYHDTEYPPEYYDENELEDGEIEDEQDPPNNQGNLHENEIIQKFRLSYYGDYIEEIWDTIKLVKKLCAKFMQSLKKPQKYRPEMETKLKEASAYMLYISELLNRALNRESKCSENNLMSLLRKSDPEFKDLVPNDELRLEYMDNITKCRDKVDLIHKHVTLLIKMSGLRKST